MGDKTFSVPRLSIVAAQRIMDEVGARDKSLDKVYKALILADEEIHSNIRLLPASRTVVSKEYLEGSKPWCPGCSARRATSHLAQAHHTTGATSFVPVPSVSNF